MASGDDGLDAALNIMRQWQWRGGDPDGNVWGISMDLSVIVNRLAIDGIARPQDAVLSLLCRGDLLASGDYRWRKYQGGNHFQLEEIDTPIKQNQWQVLADLIEAQRLDIEAGGFGLLSIDLPKLGMQKWEPYDWEFIDNRFNTSRCSSGTASHDRNYFEEWFSAWSINVSPAWMDDDFLSFDPEPVAPATNPPTSTKKGGRPPAGDWEVAALEMAGRYYRGDFKPQTIADVGRALAGWLADQDSHPSDSVVRVHAKRIFEAFQAWERD